MWETLAPKAVAAAWWTGCAALVHACYELGGPPTSLDWKRPPGWVGYYPSSQGEMLAHPCRSPYCDANHTYPCPRPECRGFQGPVDPKDKPWWPGLGYFCPFSKTKRA